MNKKNLSLIILIAGLSLFGMNAYAADGDLIVDGQLQVTGEVRVYRLPAGCTGEGINGNTLTTNTTCTTYYCSNEGYPGYYTCAGACEWYIPLQCNTTYIGKLYP